MSQRFPETTDCRGTTDLGRLEEIAYASAEMRRLRGINRPCAGGMFASTMHNSSATFSGADYVRLAIECEVATKH